MNTLLVQAIKKAGQMRTRLKLNIFESVNIFDVCAKLPISVRFIDVSMEGMYVNKGEHPDSKVILISSLRPLPRRVYTCAHELGHHLFGHGSKIDGLNDEGVTTSVYDDDEYLVDAFAGAFLMPVAGVEAEFIKRKWDLKTVSAIQLYTISSIFGTGYSTLITHCKANKLISESRAMTLLKQTPSKLLQHAMGKAVANSHFKIIDDKTDITVLDLEIGNYLFLPSHFSAEGKHLRKLKNTEYGIAFIAEHPGITQIYSAQTGRGCFVRIQNAGYIGLAENRHLEDKID